MRESTTASGQPVPKSESGLSEIDKTAQGLLEACRSHFASPEYEVAWDGSYIVWVKNKDRKRSVGLQTWLLRDHTLDEVLKRADTKLGC